MTALAKAKGEYDFVLIDCPPSLSLLTLNGLCSAHGVIVPMQCEYYALEGLSDLVNTIKKVHANLNQDLKIIGLLRVMFDPRMTLSQQVSAQLEQHFGDKVYRTVIPRNVRLAEAPSHGVPALRFDKTSKGAQAYLALAGENMCRRIAQIGNQADAPEPEQHVPGDVDFPPEKPLAAGGFIIMVVVMPSFAQRQQSEPEAVLRFLSRLIPLLAKLMHDRVDRERDVVHQGDADQCAPEESGRRAVPLELEVHARAQEALEVDEAGLDDMDNRILAPATKMNQYLTAGGEAAHQPGGAAEVVIN